MLEEHNASSSLVHTCATRHNTTSCDTTGQRTKTRRFFNLVPHISLVHTYVTRHDTIACDTTRFFAPHTIKWIRSHICSRTMSGRHDKKLLQEKLLWKRFLSCVAVTVSRKLLQKTVSIGILP